MKCPICGAKNYTNSIYCSSCGNKIAVRLNGIHCQTPSADSFARRFPIILSIMFSVGMIALVATFLFKQYIHQKENTRVSGLTGASVNLPNLNAGASYDPNVNLIASYFNCACDNCEVDDLVECDCPMAKNQKSFIQKKLDEGLTIDEVRFQVFEQYGHEKPLYTEMFIMRK